MGATEKMIDKAKLIKCSGCGEWLPDYHLTWIKDREQWLCVECVEYLC